MAEAVDLQREKFGAEGGIVLEGVAQVVDNLGNPRSQPTWSQIASLPDFASLCLNSHPFVCIFNTYLTPRRTPVFRSHKPET